MLLVPHTPSAVSPQTADRNTGSRASGPGRILMRNTTAVTPCSGQTTCCSHEVYIAARKSTWSTSDGYCVVFGETASRLTTEEPFDLIGLDGGFGPAVGSVGAARQGAPPRRCLKYSRLPWRSIISNPVLPGTLHRCEQHAGVRNIQRLLRWMTERRRHLIDKFNRAADDAGCLWCNGRPRSCSAADRVTLPFVVFFFLQ